jgi:hypothetical protein
MGGEMRTAIWREPIRTLEVQPYYGGDMYSYPPADFGKGVSYNEYYYDINPLYEMDGSVHFYEVIHYKNDEITKVEVVKK